MVGIREVSIVLTNSFAMKTIRKDGKDSWCEYPKVKNFEITDQDTVNIFWDTHKGRELILTYKFVK